MREVPQLSEGKVAVQGIFSRVTLDDELSNESDVIRKGCKAGDCNHRRMVRESYFAGGRDDRVLEFPVCIGSGSVLVERWNLIDWIENLGGEADEDPDGDGSVP